MTNSPRVASFESFKLSLGNQPPPSIPISLCTPIGQEVTSQETYRHSDSKAEATTAIFIKVCRNCFPGGGGEGGFLTSCLAPVPSLRPQHPLEQYNTCPPSAHAQDRPGCNECLAAMHRGQYGTLAFAEMGSLWGQEQVGRRKQRPAGGPGKGRSGKSSQCQ